MGAGYYGGFGPTAGASNNGGSDNNNDEAHYPESGKDYNTSNSKSAKTVNSILVDKISRSLSSNGNANSVTQLYKNGQLNQERYYDYKGKAYLDIDYTNHGNSKTHPTVPHEHSITYNDDGDMIRSTWKEIQK